MSKYLTPKAKLDEKNNIDEYEEYYLIKQNNVYKFIIETNQDELIIKHKYYYISMNYNDLSFLTKCMFNTIKDAYEYIINIFEKNKVEIKEIKFRKTFTLLLKAYIYNIEKDIEIVLLYNKENILNRYNIINEIKNLKNEINIVRKEINGIKNNNNYKSDNKFIINSNHSKVNNLETNNKINSTKDRNEIYNLNYELSVKLKNAEDKIIELKNKINKVKSEKNEAFENYIKNDYNEEYIGKQLENFYDIIVNIKSISSLGNKNEGWPIKLNENYDKLKQFLEANNKFLKVGILGNGNVGKSFLLSRIFNEKIPSGYSVITEGLSIKINQNKFYALFDSAGLQTPLLKNEKNYEQNKNNEEEFKQYENLYKDKTQTENFIQNLILYLTDMLLIVVGKITFNEQRLINKIKNELLNFNNNLNNQNPRQKKQKIFIIHNLINFQKKSQVKDHIENTLLKSASFNLKEVFDILKNNNENINVQNNEKERIYYIENYNDITIYHLIMARESTEAGDFYNNYTYEFLKERFNDFLERTPLSILEEIKNKFAEWSYDLLEKKIEKENIIIEKEGEKETKFIYDNSQKDQNANNNEKAIEIKPKACISDELGLSIYRSSGYEPTYICYIDIKNNLLVVKIELAGDITIDDSYANLEQNQIIILGNKKNNLEKDNKNSNENDENIKVLKDTTKFGSFELRIPYGNEVKLAEEDPLDENDNEKEKKEKENGIKTIKFKLVKRRRVVKK